jgi:hypothetical protein
LPSSRRCGVRRNGTRRNEVGPFGIISLEPFRALPCQARVPLRVFARGGRWFDSRNRHPFHRGCLPPAALARLVAVRLPRRRPNRVALAPCKALRGRHAAARSEDTRMCCFGTATSAANLAWRVMTARTPLLSLLASLPSSSRPRSCVGARSRASSIAKAHGQPPVRRVTRCGRACSTYGGAESPLGAELRRELFNLAFTSRATPPTTTKTDPIWHSATMRRFDGNRAAEFESHRRFHSRRWASLSL